MRRFWRSGDSTSKRVLDVLEFFYLRLWKIIVQWVAVVKFSMNHRSGRWYWQYWSQDKAEASRTNIDWKSAFSLQRGQFGPKFQVEGSPPPTFFIIQDTQLSQRHRAAGRVIVLAKSGRLEAGDIFYGHYRSIFNHCDIIGLKIYRIRWKTQNDVYYGVQGHRGRYQSTSY